MKNPSVIFPGKKEVVLVVDDDPGVKNLAKDILELTGRTVLTAGTREDALFLFSQRGKDIDIVLLDASSPEMLTAESVFQRILVTNPATKIIVTSIYSHDWNPQDVFVRGAAGFLKKPYRLTELLRVIEKVQETQ